MVTSTSRPIYSTVPTNEDASHNIKSRYRIIPLLCIALLALIALLHIYSHEATLSRQPRALYANKDEKSQRDYEAFKWCLEQCGLDGQLFDPIAPSSRAINSNPTRNSPFTVAIFSKLKKCPLYSKCTGTIIAKRYIATALHCTMYLSSWLNDCDLLGDWQIPIDDGNQKMRFHTSDLQVIVGAYNLTSADDSKIYKVERIIQFPNRFGDYMDIVLLELTTDIKFTPNQRPACLLSQFNVVGGKRATFFGFGRTRSENVLPEAGDQLIQNNISHIVDLTLLDDRICKLRYPQHNEFLCFGQPGNGLTTGDSGGMIYQNFNGRWFGVGIASFLSRGDNNETNIVEAALETNKNPDVFTRLDLFCRIISQKTNREVNCMPFTDVPSKCRDLNTELYEERYFEESNNQLWPTLSLKSNNTKLSHIACSLLDLGTCQDENNPCKASCLSNKQVAVYNLKDKHYYLDQGRCYDFQLFNGSNEIMLSAMKLENYNFFLDFQNGTTCLNGTGKCENGKCLVSKKSWWERFTGWFTG